MSTATAISQQLAEHHATAEDAYHTLVVAAARGSLPSMDTVRDITAAAGRTMDGFVDDVRHAEQRLKLAEKMGDVDAIREQLRTCPVEWQRHELQQRIQRSRDARRQLIGTCRDPSKLAEHKRLRKLQDTLRHEHHAAEQKLRSYQGQLEYARRQISETHKPSAELNAKAEMLIRCIETADQKVAAIDGRRIEAAAQLEAVEASMAEV